MGNPLAVGNPQFGFFEIYPTFVKMAKRILHILGSLSIGGAENLVLDMLRHNTGKQAGERMAEYHVIYTQPSPGSRIEDFRSTGAQVIMYGCGKGIGRTFSFIRAVRGYIKRQGIGLIHCHNNIDAYWACFASYGMKIPIVLTVHGFNLDLNFLARKFRFGLPVPPGKGVRYPDNLILRKMHPVFVSLQAKNYYMETYHSPVPGKTGERMRDFLEKAPVIYNGIDTARFIEAEPLERKDLLPPDAGERREEKALRVFVMAGSFNSLARHRQLGRRQLIICEAISLLKERNGSLPFVFLFIGEPNSGYPEHYDPGNDEYAACREFCRERKLENDIFFLPPRSDIPRVLQTADGYIYASEHDTFGLSVIEAVVAGIPVICSDIPTFREVALDGELVTLVRNVPEDFARAISRMLRELPENGVQENTASRELKERRDKAVELYSIEGCIAGYRRLYERL